MVYKFHGYRRTSFKYVDAYRHLDSSEYIGEFATLKFGAVTVDGIYYDSSRQFVTIKAPKGAGKWDVYAAADDQFSQHCRCEHGCCAHWNYSVGKVRHTKRQEWLVEIRGQQNV